MKTKTASLGKNWLLRLLMLALGICLTGIQKQISAMELETQPPSQKTAIKHIQLEEAEKYNYSPKGLLIFLNESEKKTKTKITLSCNVFSALQQKAGPFIVSTSLLQNVFSEYGKNLSTYADEVSDLSDFQFSSFKNAFNNAIDDGKLDNLINTLENSLYASDTVISIYKYLALKACHFKPDEWIIKKINDYLCLLIPTTYLNSCDINIADVGEDNAQAITPIELKMGLKVNHMKTVTIETILQQQTSIQNKDPITYFTPALYNENTQTSDIFCLRSAYSNGIIPIPIWSIYLGGHSGGGGTLLVSMTPSDVKKILNFLENKINCRLFIYSACCAAGMQIENVYKDITSAMQDSYSFPIIVKAFGDAITTGLILRPGMDQFNQLTLKPSDNYSLTTFLEKVTQPKITHYQDIIDLVSPVERDKRKPGDRAQIKMPGLEWFVPLDKADIVSIGETLTKTRDYNKPLNIEQFFKSNPKIICLYSPNIPFELKLNGTRLEAIVSMIPGNKLCVIKKISSTTYNIDSLTKMFMKLSEPLYEKIFFIHEIQGTDKSIYDVIVHYNPSHRYESSAYFKDDNTIWILSGDHLTDARKKELTGHTTDLSEYQALLEKITGEPQKIERAYYTKLVFNEKELLMQQFCSVPSAEQIVFDGLLPVGKRCIINVLDEPSQSLTHLFKVMRDTQPQDAIALIKKLTGTNDLPQLLSNGPIITLDNVIIQKNKPETLFSFDGKFYQDTTQLDRDYLPEYIHMLTQHIPFDQRKGSLLPSTITSEGIEKIKAIAPRAKPAKIEKQKYQKNPEGKWRKKKKLSTNSAPQEAEHT